MPRGKPLSAAHKAAISASMKRYWAGRRGGGGSGSSPAHKPAIINIDTNKPISREEAAIRMFGTAGAAKRLARGKKRRK